MSTDNKNTGLDTAETYASQSQLADLYAGISAATDPIYGNGNHADGENKPAIAFHEGLPVVENGIAIELTLDGALIHQNDPDVARDLKIGDEIGDGLVITHRKACYLKSKTGDLQLQADEVQILIKSGTQRQSILIAQDATKPEGEQWSVSRETFDVRLAEGVSFDQKAGSLLLMEELGMNQLTFTEALALEMLVDNASAYREANAMLSEA